MKTNKRKFMPTSLEKRFMAIFLLGAALSWAAFRYLRLIPALAVLLVGCLVVWRLLHRYLIKPIQALTMAVLESHPTEDGISYTPPVIRTSDEIELLSDAIKRMADDAGHAKK
jgi:HAMP domain.